ncbi:hypothetical protein HOO68_05845 [Candidatus Gracilibacteria bacterium]|nr:hypothetical protein [Candidatus Gracilibacteria bacterium]
MPNPRLPADMMPSRLTGTNPLDPHSTTPFAQMYAKYRLTPTVVLGTSLFTQQIALAANVPTLIIVATVAKFYMLIPNVPDIRIFIGNAGVTITSGFGLPTGTPFTFAMTENSVLWAVAGSNTLIHVLDMGI